MIIDGPKTINELAELRSNYQRDIQNLEEMCSRLHNRCSILAENDEIKDFYYLIDITKKSVKQIEEALHKLYEAEEGTEKLLLKYQSYLEIKFD